VSVEYGEGEARVGALCDVSLTIHPSERLALWGRSGSGKTTLLHVLGGLVDPTAGAVARNGAARIAYVFQGAHLLPYFTAYENVAFAGERAEELLTLVGLGSKLDNLPAELSGGEGQRVAIARALAQRPQLLLCDEPTGQLDSDTGQRVLDLVYALQGELGFALVVATHDSAVAGRSDRVLSLADGRLV
jgi:putative ABC transport system ATP-binding protein